MIMNLQPGHTPNALLRLHYSSRQAGFILNCTWKELALSDWCHAACPPAPIPPWADESPLIHHFHFGINAEKIKGVCNPWN